MRLPYVVQSEMRRILVVANETVGGEELRRAVVERASREDTEVMVVCPALIGRIKHWLSDVDRAREQATDALDQLLQAMPELESMAEKAPRKKSA